MEKSPNSERRPGNPAEQHAQNEPKSGEHPNQGTAMTTDHYEPVGKDNKENMDQPLDPAPDNVGAKRRNAVLAQPPEEFTGLKLEEPVTVAAGVRAVLQSTGNAGPAETQPERWVRLFVLRMARPGWRAINSGVLRKWRQGYRFRCGYPPGRSRLLCQA
jgi:hypothetical protein